MHQKICIVIRIWFHRKSFNLKNSSRLWPSRKLCDLSIDSIKSRPSFLNDSCKCFSFRRFQSLLPFFFSLHPPFARWQARKEEWALCHFCFLDRHLHNTWPVHGFPWTVVQVHNEDANRFARTAVIFVSRPSCPLSLLEHVFQAAILATPLIFLPDILPRVSSSPKKRKTKKD